MSCNQLAADLQRTLAKHHADVSSINRDFHVAVTNIRKHLPVCPIESVISLPTTPQ